jgi:hypothetical protein
MKLIYIAGPLKADTQAAVLANVAVAEAEGRWLRENGFAPIVPHLFYYLEDGFREELIDTYMKIDLEILRRCDALYRIQPLRKSEGSEIEQAKAIDLGIPIFFSRDDILRHDWSNVEYPLDYLIDLFEPELTDVAEIFVKYSKQKGDDDCPEFLTKSAKHHFHKALKHEANSLEMFIDPESGKSAWAHAAGRLLCAMRVENEGRKDGTPT